MKLYSFVSSAISYISIMKRLIRRTFLPQNKKNVIKQDDSEDREKTFHLDVNF